MPGWYEMNCPEVYMIQEDYGRSIDHFDETQSKQNGKDQVSILIMDIFIEQNGKREIFLK
jgi:hypothetical protein